MSDAVPLIPDVDLEETVRAVRSFFATKCEATQNESFPSLRRCLRESWFSDTLAWLLDPKARHGLGVRFLQQFLRAIAVARVRAGDDVKRRGNALAVDARRGGVNPASLSLKNAAIVREFFLSPEVRGRKRRGRRYADLVILDLDSDDRLFVVIENKLFGFDQPGQLRDYCRAIKEKFDFRRQLKVRECVYLTLRGRRSQDDSAGREWIRLSWLDDVLPALVDAAKGYSASPEIESFVELLRWLSDLFSDVSASDQLAKSLGKALVEAVGQCLAAELDRLKGEGGDSWVVEPPGVHPTRWIRHSKQRTRSVRVSLLPNGSAVISGRKGSDEHFERIVLPLGVHPSQAHNLFQMTARDIYHRLLRSESRDQYLGRARQRREGTERRFDPLFEVCHRYRYLLPLLFGANPRPSDRPADDPCADGAS